MTDETLEQLRATQPRCAICRKPIPMPVPCRHETPCGFRFASGGVSHKACFVRQLQKEA